MTTLLLALPVRRRRDVVEARQRARQIAGLLGFDPREQAGIASAVFEIGYRARRHPGGCSLHFQLDRATLQVFPVNLPGRRPAGGRLDILPLGEAGPELRLEKPLPNRTPPLDRADLPWL